MFGGGTINVNCSGTFSLGGGASNFTGTLNMLQPGTLAFVPAAGITSTFSGTINGGGSIVQNGPGTTILSRNEQLHAAARRSAAALLQANIGAGIPSASFLTLDGGVLQSNGTNPVTFTRSLGTSGGTFQWTGNGGGFSAGSAADERQHRRQCHADTLAWGTAPADVGRSSWERSSSARPRAAAATTFQNSLALGGADRTIQVDDNPNTTADFAEMSGSISGSAGIIKTRWRAF